jgi:hypothetical protein
LHIGRGANSCPHAILDLLVNSLIPAASDSTRIDIESNHTRASISQRMSSSEESATPDELQRGDLQVRSPLEMEIYVEQFM